MAKSDNRRRQDLQPTFLYVGADKAGSTWIYRMLDHHPQVYVPLVKDLFFFDRFYHLGWSWYVRHFQHAPSSARAIGELSHDYLFDAAALERIALHLPRARILASLREPVERAVSHYWYMRRIGRTKLGFAQALEAFPEIVAHSLYAQPLRQLRQLFPADQVHVLLFDDLKADPVDFGRQLSAAVGVDFLAELPYAERVLERGSARNPALVWSLRRVGWALRAVGFAEIVGRVKHHSRFQSVFFRAAPKMEPDRDMGPTQEDILRLKDYFASDVAETEQLLGRDLSAWKSAPRQVQSRRRA